MLVCSGMKKEIHPENRYVIFEDNASGGQFLLLSTIKTTETGKYKADGKEYPLFKVEISSLSHPQFTGQEKVLDTAGRVDRFKKRQSSVKSKK